MSAFLSILLGLVQGIADFLPVSGSGHLSIIQNIFNVKYNETDNLLFSALLRLGTLCAVCFVYRNDIKQIWHAFLRFCKHDIEFNAFGDKDIPHLRKLLMIVIACIPLILSAVFNDFFSSLIRNTFFIGFALIVNGVILKCTEKLITPGRKTTKNMTVVDALVIGLSQACAVIPGLSRTGATISVGLCRGLSRQSAMRFSLLISIPAVLGSFLFSLVKAAAAGITWSLVPVYLLGFLVSAIVGFFAITLLKRIIDKNRLGPFSYYCIAVGVITLVLSVVL